MIRTSTPIKESEMLPPEVFFVKPTHFLEEYGDENIDFDNQRKGNYLFMRALSSVI